MRVITTAVLLLGTVVPTLGAGPADDPTLDQRMAVARQLIQVTTAGTFMTQISNAYWPSIVANMKFVGKAPDETTLAALKQVFLDQVNSVFQTSLDDFVKVYAADFTLDELKQILAFDSSPVGMKVLQTAPLILKQIMPGVTAKIQASMPGALAKVFEEAKKRGYQIAA